MPNFLKNKMAQLWSRVVVEEYVKGGWAAAVREMCEWCMQSAEHADFFLRVCLALNEELTADILDDRKESREVTMVKDRLREGDIASLVQRWRLLLTTERTQKQLIRMSLRCISGYAPWIDVNLTANPDLLQPIYSCLESPDFNTLAVECLTAIVGKGMAVSEKLKLIVY
jgi:hypothetical protein